MSARAHLRLYDSETGEVTEYACPDCQGKEDELVELTRKLRGLAKELGELRRDKDKEARGHEAWPTLVSLFLYWQELTGHTRAKWTADRFWLALPLWKTFGTGNVAAGIAGLAYDPYRRPIKNGKVETYDDWENLLKNTAALERYIRRRPKGWVLPEQFKELV